MAEKDFNGGEIPVNPAGTTPKPRRKKGGLILKIIGVAIVCLVLLVLALPTLLSTAPVVGIVLGKVNDQLNGKVEIASLSLGWFTGVKVEGVRVMDASGAQIAELDHAVVPYPLLKALTGKFAFGDIVIDGLSFDARTDANGQLNFAQLPKPKTSEPSPPAPSNVTSPATESKPSKLPDISVNLKLTNCHGTYTQFGKPTVFLTRLEGQIGIPNINQPITDQIDAAVKLDDQSEGTVSISGSAAVIQQNQVDLATAQVHQTLDITGLDLQAVHSLIPPGAGVTTLDGALGTHLALDLTDGKTVVIDAAINAVKPIAFGGKLLQGDTFKTTTLSVQIPKLTANFPDGLDRWQSGRIKVGADADTSPILFKLDQGQVTVIADLMPQAILNLIARQKPGSDGQLVVSSTFDLAGIIPQLRHTIPEAEGVLIKSAGLTENLKLVLSTDKAQLLNSADSTPVTGTQTLANGQTKPISIPAIHLSVSAEDLGGGGVLPDLHSLALKIQSPFANGDFQGQSLSDLHGTLTANLQTLQAEISQFVDLGKINIGGDLNVDLTGSGQLTEPPYQASAKATVRLNDFKFADATGKRVDEPLTQLVLSADLQGSQQTTLESARNVKVTLTMGDASAPTVDLLAEIPSVPFTGAVAGDYQLSRLNVDLAGLQKQLAAVPAGSVGIVVNQGTLSITSSGQFSPQHLSISALAINADNLFVDRQLATGEQIAAVAGEAVHLNLAADLSAVLDANGKVARNTVHVKTLTLSDVARIIDLHKSNDGDFVFTQNGAAISGNGQLALAAQLGSVCQIAGILGEDQANAPPAAGITGGTLTGTIGLASADVNQLGVNANFNFGNISVAGDASQPPLDLSSATVAINAGLSRVGTLLNLSLNDLTASNVALNRGDIHYTARPIDVKLTAAVQSDPASPSILITQLTGNLGIATLSMPTPISVSQYTTSPTANGGIQLVGNLTDLTQLLCAYQGKAPDAYPYRGDYTLSENIVTQQATISLKGGMQIAKFQSYNGNTTTFSEDLVNVGNDLSVTTINNNQSIDIHSFTAAMQSSGAANISLTNGSIANLKTTRDMLLQLNVNYDLAKLWPIVQPMMGDKYKTLKITGQFQRQFNVNGRYPADVPSTIAIQTLHVDGDVAVASFDYNGLSLQNFILPILLEHGQLVTEFANRSMAPPAAANGGTLDLSDLNIDLTQDPPRLTTPANKSLISQVTINPLFAQSYLAKVLNNPLFSGAQQATGLLDLTVVDCDSLPLGDLVKQAVPANTGRADLTFSLTDLNIGVQGLSGLASALKQDSFTADVKDGTVSVARGISTQHMSFATGKYSLDFDGKVRLLDEAFIPLKLSIGPLPAIFSSLGVRDSNLLSNLPDRLVVPVEGTVSHASVRLDKAFGKAVKDAAAKAITNGLLGGNKNGGGDNPLGGLLRGLEKKQQN